MKKIAYSFVFAVLFVFMFVGFVSAYNDYPVTESQMLAGYTSYLSVGDKFTFTFNQQSYFVQLLDVTSPEIVRISVATADSMDYTLDEQKIYDFNKDGVEDLSVKVNDINIIQGIEWLDKPRNASITIKLFHKGTSPSSGGSGGSNSSSSCVRYYTCPDGTQVNYCSITSGGNGGGCGCLSNPSSLCSSPSNGSSGGSNGSRTNSPSNGSSGGGGSSILCNNGCRLNNTCVSVGFRVNNTYCDLSNSFLNQKTAGSTCENNFECSTNLCVDNRCVSGNLWQKIIRFFSRLFGG